MASKWLVNASNKDVNVSKYNTYNVCYYNTCNIFYYKNILSTAKD